jgi:glycosyltransferase involved in cell wall biosynthesis
MSRGPRSLHLIGSLRPSSGGPTRSVIRLCEALNALEAPAEIATVASPGEEEAASASTPIHSFPIARPRRIRRSPELERFLAAEARRFDLIHVHGLWQWPGVAGRKTAVRLGIPLVISPRGMLNPAARRRRASLKRLALGTWEGRNLRCCRLLHATSRAEASQFPRLGLTPEVRVIPNGVEAPDWGGFPPPRKGRTLLYLSRFHPLKGGELLIRVWSELHALFPEWRLELVGPDSGGVRTGWERLANTLRIPPGRIRFGDPVDGPAKWALLASSGVLVLPSQGESFGNVVLEALACGVPVIATQASPWGGLRDHGCGWWIPAGPESLGEALRAALSLSHEDREAMGRKGEAWSREFSWEAIARAMAEAYLAIGAERVGSARAGARRFPTDPDSTEGRGVRARVQPGRSAGDLPRPASP